MIVMDVMEKTPCELIKKSKVEVNAACHCIIGQPAALFLVKSA